MKRHHRTERLGPRAGTSSNPAINQNGPDLWAFVAHGTPTIFGRGSEHEASQLLGQFNYGRALNRFSIRPVNDGEIGIDPVFKMVDELERSRKALQWKGTLDQPHPAHARPVPPDQDRIPRYNTR